MSYLLDTNILLRIAQPNHPMNPEAKACVRSLFRQGKIPHLVPQVLMEFWVVATRPRDRNGLGLSPQSAKRRIQMAETFFLLVLDIPPVYREWARIVTLYSVSGVNAHDARIVAAMNVHGITHLVTFNTADFKRFHGKEITVLSPAELLASSPKDGSS